MTLINNEIKDIIKIIKCLRNRGILFKETTRNIISQERGFLNFLRPLMTAALALMKCLLKPLAKRFLVPLELLATMSGTHAAV